MKFWKGIKKGLVIASLAMALTGIVGSTSAEASTTANRNSEITTLNLSSQKAKKYDYKIYVIKGKKKRLKFGKDGVDLSSLATWTSSKTRVATVTQNGLISAKKKGTTYITAQFGPEYNNQRIVTRVVVQTPSLSKKKLSLLTGQNEQLTLKKNNQKDNLTWHSSDPSVAKVDDNGNVTAVSAGTAKIYARITDTLYTKSYRCTVTVSAPKLSKSKLSLKKGNRKTLSVKDNLKGTTVKWYSEDKSIATVSSKGKVKAKSAGQTRIIAEIKNGNFIKRLACTVTVKGTSTTTTDNTASVKNAYAKIANYVRTYGEDFDSDNEAYKNWKLVSHVQKIDEVSYYWSIIYTGAADTVRFSLIQLHDDGDTYSLGMDLRGSAFTEFMTVVLMKRDANGNGLLEQRYQTTAYIPVSSYKRSASYNFTENTSYRIGTPTANEIYTDSNILLDNAFIGWKVLLSDQKLNISIEDLGFTSYSK